jgi:addiction module HigA family antidote
MPKKSLNSPGAVLKSLIDEYQLNPNKLALAIKLNQTTIRQIVLGKAKISVPVALRLAKYFGKTAAFWLDLQTEYDLLQAVQDKELAKVLKDIKKAGTPAPQSKTGKTKTAKEEAPKKRGRKPAAAKEKAVATAKPKKNEKPAKAPKAVKTLEPKTRGRKPKVKQAAEPIQEIKFVPHVELIKKNDIVPPAPPPLPDFFPDTIPTE